LSEETKFDIEAARLGAFHQILASINPAAHLPEQIYLDSWEQFLFFQSDYIFAASFPEVIGDLIRAEQANSFCLLNLSETSVFDFGHAATLFIEGTTAEEEYYSWLRKGGAKRGWIFGVARYGCASDKGQWCIYCEKENDVAVIALKSSTGVKSFAAPLTKVHAAPIVALVPNSPSAPFPFNSLTREWQSALIENYAEGQC
jgi:hypothetical protein